MRIFIMSLHKIIVVAFMSYAQFCIEFNQISVCGATRKNQVFR